MSPELGFLLFVTLLWGPTALWLGYRTLRGQHGRFPGPFHASQLAPGEPAPLLGPDGFWVCTTCRSLNRPEVSRCYACHLAQDSPARPAAAQAPVTVGVPVMEQDSPARPAAPPEPPIPVGVPVMAAGLARSPDRAVAAPEPPIPVGVPVMAAGLARSPDRAAAAHAALATSRVALPPPETPVRAPEPAPAAPPAAALGTPVCPFLGFKNDPSTRYDFPDPTNVCHATSAGRGGAAAPRRLGAGIGGNGRTASIAIEHQRTHCLTAAHGQCARYPAAGGVAADR